MKLADALVINKADGDNKLPAETARNEYERSMRYLQPFTEGWVFMISLENFGNRIVDLNGQEILAEDMQLNQKAFIEFQGPTTTTRTSVTRIE